MSYEATAATWDTPQAVDWNLVRGALAAYLQAVVRDFSLKNSERAVYGIVIVSGQNWELSVYLNTEEGYSSMPQRFRAQCVNWPPKTDEELLASLGRWYFDAWEFGLYEFKCRPELNALNNLHYEVFESLSSANSIQGEDADVRGCFLRACAKAVAMLENSGEIQGLRRTEDFRIRFFDANCHEWETDALMERAREEVRELRTVYLPGSRNSGAKLKKSVASCAR